MSTVVYLRIAMAVGVPSFVDQTWKDRTPQISPVVHFGPLIHLVNSSWSPRRFRRSQR